MCFARVLKLLGDIDPALAWQNTSDIDLTAVVDGENVGPLVRRLHHEIFER